MPRHTHIYVYHVQCTSYVCTICMHKRMDVCRHTYYMCSYEIVRIRTHVCMLIVAYIPMMNSMFDNTRQRIIVIVTFPRSIHCRQQHNI